MSSHELSQMPFVPKWLGEPLYPGGFPLQPDRYDVTTGVDGASSSIRQRIHDYYLLCFTEDGQLLADPPLSEDDFQVLRQWMIYMLHAPIWSLHSVESFEAVKEKALAVRSWAELSEVGQMAMDFGLDIL